MCNVADIHFAPGMFNHEAETIMLRSTATFKNNGICEAVGKGHFKILVTFWAGFRCNWPLAAVFSLKSKPVLVPTALREE